MSNRRKAYLWLSKQLQIDVEMGHIAYFNEDVCKRLIEICDYYEPDECLNLQGFTS